MYRRNSHNAVLINFMCGFCVSEMHVKQTFLAVLNINDTFRKIGQIASEDTLPTFGPT